VSETKLIRPGQVTLAGWMVMIGSAIVVLTCFDQVSGFQTMDSREAIAKFLSEPPAEGLGLDVDGAIVILRSMAMVTAGLATAALILGWHVLHRHRASRMALTIVAVPLFFTGIVAGGFFSSVVAAAALMLWSRPARDWFDGVSRPIQQPVRRPSGAAEEGTPEARSTLEPGTTSAPPTSPPPTSPPPVELGAPPVGPPYAGLTPPLSVVRRRPDVVLWACVLTWTFSAVTAVFMLITAALVPAKGHEVLAEARRQNPDLATMSDGLLLTMMWVIIAGLLLWAVAAMALAWLVWSGHEWARITLICSAATAGVFALIAVFTLVFPLPLMIACGVVARMLLTPDCAAWCRSRPARP